MRTNGGDLVGSIDNSWIDEFSGSEWAQLQRCLSYYYLYSVWSHCSCNGKVEKVKTGDKVNKVGEDILELKTTAKLS